MVEVSSTDVEEVEQGEEVIDARSEMSVSLSTTTTTHNMRHVLVLVHGNNGAGIDWDFVKSRLVAATDQFLVVRYFIILCF